MRMDILLERNTLCVDWIEVLPNFNVLSNLKWKDSTIVLKVAEGLFFYSDFLQLKIFGQWYGVSVSIAWNHTYTFDYKSL